MRQARNRQTKPLLLGVDGLSSPFLHDCLLHLPSHSVVRPTENCSELMPRHHWSESLKLCLQAFRRVMWKVIVEDEHGLGEETVFDFKHIPALSKTTKAEKGRRNYAGHGVMEKRNLRAFLFGCGLFMVLLWITLRSLRELWGRGAALCNV